MVKNPRCCIVLAFVWIAGCFLLTAEIRKGLECGLLVSTPKSSGHNAVGVVVGAFGEVSRKVFFLEAAPRISVQPLYDSYYFKKSAVHPNDDIYADDVQMMTYRNVSRYTPIHVSMPVRIGIKIQMPREVCLTCSAGILGGIGLLGDGYSKTFLCADNGGQILESENRIGNLFCGSNGELPEFSSRWELGLTSRIGVELPSRIRIGIEFEKTCFMKSYRHVSEINSIAVMIGFMF